ncbi:MAG: hypothetical protein DHS20C11_12200 [Lysobacteraceae bacterium]|nr:MAG: hypothetical protein DHS20C11_12200 [Xanthomonadaceae bacterium]
MASHRIFTLLLLTSLAACASSQGPQRNSDSPLADTNWQLLAIAGQASIESPHPVTLGIEETAKEIRGRGPCNRYFGNVQINDESATFIAGALAATKMYCGQPEGVMDLELKFMSAFNEVRQYVRDGQSLSLQDTEGNEVLAFTQVFLEQDQ